jgi:hypothetical protein
MSTYDLLEHFAETEDPKLLKVHKALNDGSNYVSKNIFKDPRLDKLWAKAEMAGFSGIILLEYFMFIFIFIFIIYNLYIHIALHLR